MKLSCDFDTKKLSHFVAIVGSKNILTPKSRIIGVSDKKEETLENVVFTRVSMSIQDGKTIAEKALLYKVFESF